MLCWYSWETGPFLNRKGGWIRGWEQRGGGWKERREGKRQLGCKINKFIFKKEGHKNQSLRTYNFPTRESCLKEKATILEMWSLATTPFPGLSSPETQMGESWTPYQMKLRT